MLRALFPALCLALAQTAAAADTPMSAAAFERYATGKTFSFAQDGTPYGVEQYLPGRRVVWSFLGGKCRKGRWYADRDGRICFVYEGRPEDPQCWIFFTGEAGVSARFEGEPSSPGRVEVERISGPLECDTPFLGV